MDPPHCDLEVKDELRRVKPNYHINKPFHLLRKKPIRQNQPSIINELMIKSPSQQS